MGGMSTEREVSLKSGAAVLGALRERGWNAHGVDVGPDLPQQLIALGADVAWIALHGQFGEDGCVQGLLEVMRIPYTGSGVRGSAVAMDKITTKRLLADAGIPMPADSVWRAGEPIPEDLPMPVVAKFPEGGSTLGLEIVRDPEDLERALVDLSALGGEVLLEQFVAGDEITVAVLEGRALPVVSIVPDSGFFDFEAKYTKGRTRYIVPAPIDPLVAEAAQRYAVTAYERLDLGGVARADFIVDADGVPWFLEINTIPGMTATSLSPMAAGAVGIDFGALVEEILCAARLRIERRDHREKS
ncbi:MAG: D-alanine--D-alanine ligase [Alphaproteobacteria bacterium]|nr:D-alanine--D-alanine ligase [Alphaproteobacteria bacterium]